LGVNENITLNSQTLDHDGTDFVFGDDVRLDTGVLWLDEAADDQTAVAGIGQLWVTNDATQVATFTDDANVKRPLSTQTKSMNWDAGSWTTDGTGCTDAAETVIPASGGEMFEVSCADSDTARAFGKTFMPDGWDAGAVQFFMSAHHAASEVITCLYDVTCQCVGDGEAWNNTYTTEAAATEISIVMAATADQNQFAGQSSAITCTGTCAAGDMLRWEMEVDATGSGTNCANTNLLSMKMEYVWNADDSN
jgi:hypothetical protein